MHSLKQPTSHQRMSGIGHERIDLLADALKLRLLHNGFAQFPRFLEDHIFSLNICFHRVQLASIRFVAPVINFYPFYSRQWSLFFSFSLCTFLFGLGGNKQAAQWGKMLNPLANPHLQRLGGCDT